MPIKPLIALFVFLMSGTVVAQQIESGVIVETLPDLSVNSLGTDKSIYTDLWQTTDSKTLLDIIGKIGVIELSPASKKLAKYLLLQDTTGQPFADSQNLLKEDIFFIERLNALFRLGEWDDLLKLIDLVPEKQQSEEIQKIKINTLLMKGQNKKACTLLEQQEFKDYTDKMRLSCFLAQEEKEKAVLSYDVYLENASQEDSLLNALNSLVLRELPETLPENFIIKPEHVFLFSLLKEPQADWNKQSDGIQKTLTDLPTTPIPLRIQLAEQIALTATEMARIYNLPLLQLKPDEPHLKRADLFQQIKASASESEKAHLLAIFISSAKDDKILLNIAPLLVELLNEIVPQKAYEYLAFDAVQIYGLKGNLSAAAAWHQILEDSLTEKAKKQRLLLVPLMNQLGAGYPRDIDSLINNICPGKKNKECSHFWSVFKSPVLEEYESTFEGGFPPLSQEKQQTGENILNTLFELNQKDADVQKLFTFIRQIKPRNLSGEIEREKMVFQ